VAEGALIAHSISGALIFTHCALDRAGIVVLESILFLLVNPRVQHAPADGFHRARALMSA